MAPEQLSGGETDARTDLFAFGLIIYEMVAGKPAYEPGRARGSIEIAISDFPPGALRMLRRLVEGCLANSPDHRWQSAQDLRIGLRWIVEDHARARRATTIAHPLRTRRIAAVATALGAGFSILRRMRRREQTPPPRL
jgi:serine/threonine-protein kinase